MPKGSKPRALKPRWYQRLGFWQNLAKLVLPVAYLAFGICVIGIGIINMLEA